MKTVRNYDTAHKAIWLAIDEMHKALMDENVKGDELAAVVETNTMLCNAASAIRELKFNN